VKTLIIIPAYNEEASVAHVVGEVRSLQQGYDIVVVNDGSADATEERALAAGAVVLSLPINLGIGAAVQTGFRYAVRNGYDVAVQVDGDGQHPAGEIPKLVGVIETGLADVAIGSRFLERKGFQSTFARRIGIRYFRFLHAMVTGVHITDSTSGFRAINRRTLEIVNTYYPDEYPESESIVLYAHHNLRIREVPVVMRERMGGQSSIRAFASVYYMFKVTLAILFTHIRLKRGRS